MKKPMITNAIRSIYFSKLIPAVFFLIFTAFILYKYPFQEILFPKRLNSVEHIFDEYNNGQEFLEITVPSLHYMGYDYTKNSHKVGSYYYSFIDNRCVIFLLSNKTSQQSAKELKNITIVGKLIKDSENSNQLEEHFANDLLWTKTDLKKITAEFIVSEPDAFILQVYILLLIINIVAFYAIFSIILSIIYIRAPHLCPMCKHLGKENNLKQALSDVDMELSTNPDYKASNIFITSNYLIELYKYKVQIIPLDKITWAYMHSTLSKLRGISYHVVICSKYGAVKLKNKQKFEADSILDYVSSNDPTVLIGYSKEHAKLYNQLAKNKR